MPVRPLVPFWLNVREETAFPPRPAVTVWAAREPEVLPPLPPVADWVRTRTPVVVPATALVSDSLAPLPAAPLVALAPLPPMTEPETVTLVPPVETPLTA